MYSSNFNSRSDRSQGLLGVELSGFLLLETSIVLFLLAFCSLALTSWYIHLSSISKNLERRLTAIHLASIALEELRAGVTKAHSWTVQGYSITTLIEKQEFTKRYSVKIAWDVHTISFTTGSI